MRQSIVVAYVLSLIMSVQVVHAEMYKDQISKSFPGFVIMERSEFTSEIQQTLETNPALIIGKFNHDEIDDFAALIRRSIKKRYEAGARSYDYFENKLVVCHGLDDVKFKCVEISSGITILPENSYILKSTPGKINCDVYGSDYRNVKNDSISLIHETAASQYIYQPDGTYLKCITAD